jgi:hypothetical protein
VASSEAIALCNELPTCEEVAQVIWVVVLVGHRVRFGFFGFDVPPGCSLLLWRSC